MRGRHAVLLEYSAANHGHTVNLTHWGLLGLESTFRSKSKEAWWAGLEENQQQIARQLPQGRGLQPLGAKQD